MATHEGWNADPTLVTNFYNMLRGKCAGTQPCEGHKLLAALEKEYDVRVITQNVDNLHEAAGSTKVLHLHGELMKVCSSKDTENPTCWQTLTADNYEVKPGTKAADGSLLRPYIVFFGEAVPNMEKAIDWVADADIFVIIGSSLVVYPAASLAHYVTPSTPVYLIDPAPSVGMTISGVTHIQKGASEGVKELIELLGQKGD